MEVPLFPLNTVLFPGGSLKLRVFERRYLDMVSESLRSGAPFGVCLIKQGREVGGTAEPHNIGTLAHIVDWEQRSDGLLGIKVEGGGRFRVEVHHIGPHDLLLGRIAHLEEPPATRLPPEFLPLAGLLNRILTQIEAPETPAPDYDDACWVSCRLAEVLPLPLPLKQELLELNDPLERLTALHRYLAEPSRKAL